MSEVHYPPEGEQDFGHRVELVYRFLYCRVGNREDAEELTALVFLLAEDRLDVYEPDAPKGISLIALAEEALQGYWSLYYGREPHSPGNAPEVLSVLPEDDRRVLDLSLIQGRAPEEVAQELGVPAGELHATQQRALARAVEYRGDR